MIRLAVAVILAAAGVIAFLPGRVAPWSRLNNTEEQLDLFSGRVRVCRHYRYWPVNQEICETPLSEALTARQGPKRGEKWVKVNVCRPGVVSISPHVSYDRAFYQMAELAGCWETGNFDRNARAKTGQQLLRVWRDGGSYHCARPYLEHLRNWVATKDPDQPTTADDIPNDLADRSLAAYAEERAQP